jgi:hypothetical protein
MEESAVFASVEHEQIQADIGALFRAAIRVTLECLLEQEVREMVVGARRYERLGTREATHMADVKIVGTRGSIEPSRRRGRVSPPPERAYNRRRMVRLEQGRARTVRPRCCIGLAGGSPAAVSAGAPRSRLRVSAERTASERSVESPAEAERLCARGATLWA